MSSVAFHMEGGHDADGHPVPLDGVTAEVLRRHIDSTWKHVIDHRFGLGSQYPSPQR